MEMKKNARAEKKKEKKTVRNHCIWTVVFAWLKLFIQNTVSFIYYA